MTSDPRPCDIFRVTENGAGLGTRLPTLYISDYTITSYVTMQLQCIAAFGGLRAKLQQMKVVLCCLDGESVVGSRKDPVLVAYSY